MTKHPSHGGRFVYLTEVDISVDNGPGINEREFVSALLRRHRDEVVCILPEPQRPDVFHDARIRYVRAHRNNPARYLGYLWDSKRAVKRLLDEGQIAALVFRLGGTPLLPYSLSHSTRTPILLKKLALHAIFGDEVTRSPMKNAVSRSMLPMYRSVIQEALAADVESFTYVEWLHERFGIGRDRMKVIPNGVNTRVFQPGADAEERRAKELDAFDTVIGYVGALSRVRKVGDLLRAFADLEDSERVALVLLGSGPDEDSLRSEASTLGLGNRVRFVGSVPYSEVPAWMRCFDVAVDPTAVRMRTSKGPLTASYSQKIGQYLASGLPVLAWQCRDTDFLEEEGVGRVVPYPAARALVPALQDLIRMTEDHRDEIRGRAREVAERRFDSQVLADKRVAWWREVVDNPPA